MKISKPELTAQGSAAQAENIKKIGSRRWLALWPLGLYALLTLVFTWPLVLHLGERGISVRSGDLWQNLWNIWWVKHALFELSTSPFKTDLLFYPDSPSLYLHALNPLGGLLTSPLQALFGLVTAFNLWVLLVFTFGAYATYGLARYLKLAPGGAFLAGLIFAYSPIISSELDMGQLEQITLLWLPLFILFFLRALRSNVSAHGPPWRDGAFWRDAVLAAVFLLFTTLTTWYYTLDLLIFMGLTLGVLGAHALRRRERAVFGRMAIVTVVCAVLQAPMAFLTIRAAASTPSAAARASSIRYNSADLFNFFVPGRSVLWFSGSVEGQEFRQFLGYGTLLLVAVAVVAGWQKARSWLVLALVFLVLALGPELKTGLEGYTGVPLPGALIQSLPVVGSFFRVPVRLVAFAMLPLGLLAGIGLDWLTSRLQTGRLKGVRLGLIIVLVSVVFLEYFPGPRQTVSLALSQEAWRKIQPPGAVLTLPYHEIGSLQMYAQTVHAQPVVGGYLARVPGFDFLEQAPIIRELTQRDFGASAPDFVTNNFETTLLPALNLYGVRYLVIHRDLFSVRANAALDKILEPILKGNPLLSRDGRIEIYRVPQYRWPAVPLAGWLDRGTGWYEEEKNVELGTYRWAEREATLTLLNPNPRPVRYRLEWTLFSFGPPRQVQIRLNGYSVGQKEAAAPQPQSFEIELPPGRSTLTLNTDQPPTKPSQLDPSSTDQRSLAFAIARLRLSVI